jgi:hypothetical protein
VQSEAGRIGSIAEKEGLRQTKMRTKSGMNDELAPGQLFVTPASPSPYIQRFIAPWKRWRPSTA